MGPGDLSSLPPALLIGLAVLVVVQVGLIVIALIDLYRRPLAAVNLGNKWVWVAIILLVNLLGPILYLLVGRRSVAPAEEPTPAPTRTKRDIAEALYGPDETPRP